MNNEQIEHQKTFFEFITMTQQLRNIERTIFYKDSPALENDLEHGYQLTLLAWMMIDYLKLPLNKDLAIKYALAHDIIEVYAGDTNPFDPKDFHDKKERELQSLERLKQQFGKSDIWEYIKKYQEKSEEEAKFIYALDKLIPEYNVFLTEGKAYQHFQIKREELVQHISKANIYEPLKPFIDDIIQTLYRGYHSNPL